MATLRGDGRWMVSVRVDGRRRYAYGKTEQEANDAGARLRLGITDQQVQASTQRLGEYLSEWIEAVDVRERTRASYAHMLTKHVVPVLGHRTLASLHRRDVQRMVDGIAAAPRTVSYAHGVLRRALNDAVRREALPLNPAVGVVLPKRAASPARSLTPGEVRALLDASSERWARMFRVTLACGLRKAEAIALHADDVRDGKLHVQRSVSYARGSFHIAPGKTDNARRVVPVPASVLPLLIGDGYLFQSDSGTFNHPRNVTRAFNRARDRAGVQCRFHDLRHTYATWLLESGVPLWKVSKLLGHGSINITADIYGHAVPATDDVSAIDDALRL